MPVAPRQYRSAGAPQGLGAEGTHDAADHQAAGAADLSTHYARLGAANAFTVGGHVITNAAVGTIPLVVKGTNSQSADLFQVQNSGGTVYFAVTASGLINFRDAAGIGLVAPATNGLKIATATTQKLGFWNATPVVQPTAVADVVGTPGLVYGTGEQTMLNDLEAAVNAILARMRTTGFFAT